MLGALTPGGRMLGALTLPLLPICPPSNWFYRG